MQYLAIESRGTNKFPPIQVAGTPRSSSSAMASEKCMEGEEDSDSVLYFTDISRPQTTNQDKGRMTDTPLGRLSAARLTPIENTVSKKKKIKKGLSPIEIKREIYKRECIRLNVIPVSAYLKAPSQTSITLRHYNIGINGAKALSAPIMLDNKTTEVDIVGNLIGPQGLEYLLEALIDNRNFTYLNLSQNNLSSDGAKLLGDFIKRSVSLEILIVSNNGFKDEDARYFTRAIKINRSLKELVLSHNMFDERAGKFFGLALAVNENLESFDISWNRIRQRGAALFSEGFAGNVGLKKLNISFNGFGTEGTAMMATALRDNRTLLSLDMSHNRIKDLDAAVFAKQLSMNDTLKSLMIGDNLITTGGATILLQCLHDEESKCQLEVLDLKNTGVDMIFYRMLQEVKDKKQVEVIHGKTMCVGEPPIIKKKSKSKVGFKSKSSDDIKKQMNKNISPRETGGDASQKLEEFSNSDQYEIPGTITDNIVDFS